MLLTKNSAAPLEIKAVGDAGEIEGYGSIFGNVDSYGEVVMPGAFTASLKAAARANRTVKMLWQHYPDQPIGVWHSLEEDSKGLYVKGRLLVDASAQARETHALLKDGALEGLSIGYRLEKYQEDPDRQGVIQLMKLDLREVSVVTFAANEKARVEAVKHVLAAGGVPTVREFEELLREAGFSKSLATAIATRAAPCLRGDPDGEASAAVKFLKRLHAGLGISG
ncbi:MAG TPA: HK97 family phage prohead protease [Sphingomicrobium sp.]|jgi:HK97 family phage prohead protease